MIPPVPHRRNPDGTYDAICPICFLTISSSKNEQDLAAPVAAHTCDKFLLQERDAARQKLDSRMPDSSRP
jgi:hypothetical protein